MKATQLRKSILQLAIQGKLVPQIPSEEPASILLAKINAEKQELIKQGKIKRDRGSSPITEDEIPFDIPESWEWVRLGNIADMYTGDSINEQEKERKYKSLNVGYNYIGTKDVSFKNEIAYENGVRIPFETSFKIAKSNSILLCIEGGSAGKKIGILNQDVCFGNKLCCFLPILISEKYLFYFLNSQVFLENFTGNKTGMIGGVGVNVLKSFLFILPPFDEQQRIVARLEEIMPLIDEYEKYETELSELDANIQDKLKKSFLQYAIQGKLVPQIDTAEPASELLKRIQSEKQELIKQGKIKKEKELPPITDDEKPFEIPESWCFVRLGEVISLLSGRDLDPQCYNNKKIGLPYLTGASNIENEQIIINRWTNQPQVVSQQNDLIISCKGTVGEMAINYIGELHIARQIMACRCLNGLNIKYLKIFLSTYVNVLKSTAKSMIPGISRDMILNAIIPLPPIKEQAQIVEYVEQFFELVNNFFVKKQQPINIANIINFMPPNASQTPNFAQAAQGNPKDLNKLFEDEN